MGRNLYKTAVKLCFAAFFGLGTVWNCANPMAPQGGPRDTLPPRVIPGGMAPAYGTTNFKEKRIFIEFDEYVVLKDQHKEFYMSPFASKQPTLTIKGRGIQIDLKDTLKPDQTYSLNFCGSVQDNNEGNPLNDLRYVFSTGATIDSMLMSGYTVDARTRDSVSKTYILFYDARRDTAAYDSLPFKAPDAVARAQANGLFIAENLKPIDYRVYAMEDKNDNRLYDPGIDRVAFLDSVCNPTRLPGFTVRYDTTRKYNVPDPQLYFRLFMDEGFRRQHLSKASRPSQHRIDLVFGAKYPKIDSLTLYGIDSSRIITQYYKPTRDSLSLWLDVPSAELPDTIRGSVTYLKHDSLNVLRPVTEKLALAWKYFEPKKKDRNDTLPPPNPFRYKVDARQELNPYHNIPFTFEIPVSAIDSAAVTLTRSDKEGNQYRARFRFEQDTANMLHWALKSAWVPEGQYELVIPAGAIGNIAGQRNDTLRAKFTVMPASDYAVINLTVKGKTPESRYVIQILDQGGKVMRETRGVRDGKYTFDYLEISTVRIRVIEDDNGNGEWDSGRLIQRIQPERAEIFLTGKGEAELVLRKNYTYDYDMDMSKVFAPVTMQGVMEQLRVLEAERIQKMMKQRAEQPRNQNQNQPQGGGMGFGGLNTGIPMPTR